MTTDQIVSADTYIPVSLQPRSPNGDLDVAENYYTLAGVMDEGRNSHFLQSQINHINTNTLLKMNTFLQSHP